MSWLPASTIPPALIIRWNNLDPFPSQTSICTWYFPRYIPPHCSLLSIGWYSTRNPISSKIAPVMWDIIIWLVQLFVTIFIGFSKLLQTAIWYKLKDAIVKNKLIIKKDLNLFWFLWLIMMVCLLCVKRRKFLWPSTSKRLFNVYWFDGKTKIVFQKPLYLFFLQDAS